MQGSATRGHFGGARFAFAFARLPGFTFCAFCRRAGVLALARFARARQWRKCCRHRWRLRPWATLAKDTNLAKDRGRSTATVPSCPPPKRWNTRCSLRCR